MNDRISQKEPVKIGCPPSSILGPFLFSMFINDLVLCLERCESILYADDTTLIFRHRCPKTIVQNIQKDLYTLINYFGSNCLSLNLSKTEFMLLNAKVNGPMNLTVDNIVIKTCTKFKYLGIWFDDKLQWNTHVDHLLYKLSSAKFMLNNTKNFMNLHSKKLLYFAHFYTHLLYGLPVWGPHINKSQRDLIFKKQKAIIRIIGNSSYNAHTDPLFKKLELLKFDNIIKQEILKISFHLNQGTLPVKIDKFFTNISTHYNLRGRQKQIQTHRSKIFNDSLLCKCITLWNGLPMELKLINNYQLFTKKLRKYLLNTQ